MILVHDLESMTVKDEKVVQFYLSELNRNSKFTIQSFSTNPLKSVESGKEEMQVLLLTNNMKKFADVHLHIASEFLFVWLVEMLYRLHPQKSRLPFFAKMSKSDLFMQETSFSAMIAQREGKYNWVNPLKVVVRESVVGEK